MKKLLVICISLIIISNSITAQKTKDVIYLKNGSVIYGTLTEISQEQYRVKGSDGSIFIFKSEEVERFVKETPQFEGRKEKGPGFSLEAGLLLGPQASNYAAPFSFNTVISYTADARNIIGLGTGAEFLGKTYTPLFFEFRHLLSINKAAPFIFFRSGALLYLGSDDENNNIYYPQYYLRKEYSGGASVTAGTGISWAGEELETYLSFAFRYAQTSYVQSEYNQLETTFKNNFRRLEIKFGFKF